MSPKNSLMHYFEPQNDPKAFRNALGQYPTGVAIVTTRTEMGEDVGMTMNSFCAVSLDPPLVLFCVNKSAHSFSAWRTGSVYGISILSEGHDVLAAQFAKPLINKWSGVPLRRGIQNIALIEGSVAQFECMPYAQYEGGDHVIFVVCVERYAISASPGPLAVCKGRYNHLQPGAIAPPDWPLPIHY